LAQQTSGDCQKIVCDANGGSELKNDDIDLPNDNNPCTTDGCANGHITYTNLGPRAPCNQGGSVCDGDGHCVGCVVADDCQGDTPECKVCDNHLCAPPSGNAISQQERGDCHLVVCDGSGSTVNRVDDTDLPIDGNPCSRDVCTSGTIGDQLRSA
jgi:hypothetical protein